jgi:hypothetical protein
MRGGAVDAELLIPFLLSEGMVGDGIVHVLDCPVGVDRSQSGLLEADRGLRGFQAKLDRPTGIS